MTTGELYARAQDESGGRGEAGTWAVDVKNRLGKHSEERPLSNQSAAAGDADQTARALFVRPQSSSTTPYGSSVEPGMSTEDVKQSWSTDGDDQSCARIEE